MKLNNSRILNVLQFLCKKHHRKSDVHNLPILSNVRVTETGYVLNLRLYNRKKKAWDKKKDVKFDDKAVIEVLEYQMNYRSEEDYAMMRKDFKPKVLKLSKKAYREAKFVTAKSKRQTTATDFGVVVMDDNGTKSGKMGIGEVHELLSRIL